MGSDDKASPKATSAAPACPDMSFTSTLIASVQDRDQRACRPAPKETE